MTPKDDHRREGEGTDTASDAPAPVREDGEARAGDPEDAPQAAPAIATGAADDDAAQVPDDDAGADRTPDEAPGEDNAPAGAGAEEGRPDAAAQMAAGRTAAKRDRAAAEVPGDAGGTAHAGERVAKVIARAGVASRRDAEALVEAGRVTVNGRVLDSPAFNVTAEDDIRLDGEPIPQRLRTRAWLFNKPKGLVTTNRDPDGRATVFDALPPSMPRVVTVGRLDINTEGLLILTNDGGLARVLELPSTGWTRKYRVRVHGEVDEARLAALAEGTAVDGVLYGPIHVTVDRLKGDNAWLTVALAEGKNREVKVVLGTLGLSVTRLIRVSFGPFQLGDLPRGELHEVPTRQLKDQLGPRLAAEAGADFDAPAVAPPRRERPASAGPRRGGAKASPSARSGTKAPRPARSDAPTGKRPPRHASARYEDDREPAPRRDRYERDGDRPSRAGRPGAPRGHGKATPYAGRDRDEGGPAGPARTRPAADRRERDGDRPQRHGRPGASRERGDAAPHAGDRRAPRRDRDEGGPARTRPAADRRERNGDRPQRHDRPGAARERGDAAPHAGDRRAPRRDRDDGGPARTRPAADRRERDGDPRGAERPARLRDTPGGWRGAGSQAPERAGTHSEGPRRFGDAPDVQREADGRAPDRARDRRQPSGRFAGTFPARERGREGGAHAPRREGREDEAGAHGRPEPGGNRHGAGRAQRDGSGRKPFARTAGSDRPATGPKQRRAAGAGERADRPARTPESSAGPRRGPPRDRPSAPRGETGAREAKRPPRAERKPAPSGAGQNRGPRRDGGARPFGKRGGGQEGGPDSGPGPRRRPPGRRPS